jgi:D-alanyl-D-alanine carboxypeptidase/D-alanyl-D-alanine-endopeptidase (penicillin-binding protein 4)
LPGSRIRPFCAALVLLTTLAVIGAAPAVAEPTRLERRLDSLMSRGGLRGAKVSALVVRVADGQVLYSRSPDRALIPASNMKVLTALAALATFGPTHRFETVLLADRAPDVAGSVGDLAVKGGGDPVLNSEDWWRMAADLRRTGLRQVRGDLLVDDTHFDSEFWHPGWGKVSSRAYHAPIGALTANYGAFFVNVIPGARANDAVRVEVDPPIPYLEISNLAVTGSRRAKRSLSVDRATRAGGGETVRVRGAVRAGDDPDLFPRSVADPALYAGEVFKMQLEANGISVAGSVRRASCDPYGHELMRFEGRQLADIVRLFMKYSNNSIAETLVKAMGAEGSATPGSWQSGLVEMRRQLLTLGLDGDAMHFVDGSGLSPENRLTPRLLVQALQLASNSFELGPELVTSLPLAGRDGTLAKRAYGAIGHVRAKTGLLSSNKVTSLSGFAQLRDGERVAFAILVNEFKGGARAAMDGVDEWVAELSRGQGRPKSDASTPRPARKP